MDGLLLVDKRTGPTSHDIVAGLRRALELPKAGHFGTLDPMATGLLIVAFGQATRLNRFYAGRSKTYRARVRLGVATDTYDAEGAPRPGPAGPIPSRETVETALTAFLGAIAQVPPPYSAKKVAGTPLYKHARAGRPVTLAPVPVFIHELFMHGFAPPDLDLEVRCSTGTYIRSLAEELGRSLGCGAHLAALRRTAVGEMSVEKAVDISAWSQGTPDPAGLAAWIPLTEMLPEWPKADLDAIGSRSILDGRTIPPDQIALWSPGRSIGERRPEDEESCRVFDAAGRLVALARKSPGTGALAPFLVFSAS
jgi:tRNA pseudouridine55 synthase